nr:extracellular solute-binding protein [Paenibacillus alvei]
MVRWKFWKLSALLLAAMLLVSGCLGDKPVLEPLEEGKGKIKVLYYNEEAFYRQYGNYFNIKFPDIEFEVVGMEELNSSDDYQEALKKMIEKHKPDVMLLSEDIFETFAEDGKLYGLDDIIAQEKFDLEDFMPGLIERIKSKGGGKLYGLAPSFYTRVLYYNEDLFKEHHIELPNNKMSWKDVLDLAGRFSGIGSGEDQVYGYYQEYGNMSNLFQDIVSSSSLKQFDAKGEKLLINADGWKQAFTLATDAMRSKAVYMPPKGEEAQFMNNNLFVQGKAAMMMSGTWLAQEIDNRPTYDKKAKKFAWNFVTGPIDPSSPDESTYVNLSEIYTVSADSANKRAAWEFVKFVNGNEMAKAASRSMMGSLPTRMKYKKDIAGKSSDPLYMLKPKSSSAYGWWNKHVPSAFYSTYDGMVQQALEGVIEKKKSVDEAVAELEAKGQAALTKAHEDEKARKAKEKGKESSSTGNGKSG